jgi:two-component system phosphate regulon sensor histidine kinase PhoR
VVARRLSTPVRQLKEVATAISGGELSRRFLRYTSSDIGALGRAFDTMADRLQEKIGDITEARDRLRAILSGMVEGVLVCDRDERIILANRALMALLELSDDPAGRTIAQTVRSSELREAVKSVLAGRDQITLQIRTLGQTSRALEVHVARLTGEAGRGGAVAVFHDITERERLDRMRRDFVANLSHELRTPLTTMRGALETLLDGAMEDPHYSRHFVESTLRQAERLGRLVEDLLDLSRLESGQQELEVEEFPAAELAHSALETVSELAWSRKVELSLTLGHESVMIKGDQNQLEQALINLLHNAIAYNKEGGSVSLDITQSENEVCLQVSDNGVGIAPEHLPRLFERFYRVDKNRSRSMGGTGLGLAIVKHIVQAHSGRVQVESRLGRGSTFSICIPS